jgi:cellulose biosynthesis protein BcsQ
MDKALPKIVTFFNTKGGAGKSKLCLGLAYVLHKHGSRVLIVDSDPEQATAANVTRLMDPESTFPVDAVILQAPRYPDPERPGHLKPDTAAYLAEVVRLGESYDYIFIDLPARSEEPEQLAALIGADFVIIPSKPGRADVRVLRDIGIPKLAKSLVNVEQLPVIAIVPNAVQRHNVDKVGIEELTDIAQNNDYIELSVTAATIPDSVALEEMTALNVGLDEVVTKKPARDAAITALTNVALEVRLLNKVRPAKRKGSAKSAREGV